jgi:hypothetical protein
MKRLLASTLAALGCAVAAAHADDLQWRPAAPPAASFGVSLGSPVVLGRPMALPAAVPAPAPPFDSAVTRVSFETPVTLARPIVRAQGGDSFSTWDRNDTPPTTASSGGFATLGSPVGAVRPTAFAGETPASEAPAPAAAPFGSALDGGCGCSSGGCCDPCCSCCDPCCDSWWHGHSHCFYGSGEYLMWWIRGANLPALVTSGPAAPGPVLGLEGALGQPGTSILFGAGNQRYDVSSGARFTVGWWCDCEQTKGIEFTYFFIGPRDFNYTANSNEFPVLARPFFNVNNMIEFSEITASPGLSTGSISVNSHSSLWGAEANYRCNVCCDCDFHFDALAGFRFLQLNEDVNITENINVLPTVPVVGGDTVLVSDRFGTRNSFTGAQIGGELGMKVERWSFDLTGKLAFGNNHEVINIEGSQAIRTPAGAVSVVPGGLLALPSNSGRFTMNRFSFVPEWGAKVAYNVTDNWKLTLGYTFIYWTNVVRPGDQIDRNLNINQIPNFAAGPATNIVRPVVPFKETSFWAQGLSFGMEYDF